MAGRKPVRPKTNQSYFPGSSTAKPHGKSQTQGFNIKDLPYSYGETKFVLMVRDPYWAFSYWDFSGDTWEWVQTQIRGDSSLKPVIRIHDLSAKQTFDLLVALEVRNWYLCLGTPDHRYLAELGLGSPSRFLLIAKSNEVCTPRNTPSSVIDPEWPAYDFEDLFGQFVNLRASSSPSSHTFQRKP